jgi:hypothetical protein
MMGQTHAKLGYLGMTREGGGEGRSPESPSSHVIGKAHRPGAAVPHDPLNSTPIRDGLGSKLVSALES